MTNEELRKLGLKLENRFEDKATELARLQVHLNDYNDFKEAQLNNPDSEPEMREQRPFDNRVWAYRDVIIGAIERKRSRDVEAKRKRDLETKKRKLEEKKKKSAEFIDVKEVDAKED
jgi:hypothetical protein